MKQRKLNKKKLLRFVLALLSILLGLAALVLIPLKTHRPPQKEIHYTERPASTPEPEPVLTPEPLPTEQPDPRLPDRDADMQALLEDFAAQHPGTWDIYVYNLGNGQYAAFRTGEDEPMIAAGLIRVFIMASAFQQFEEGRLSYWDYNATVRKMIDIGDNFCANYLISRLGGGVDEAGFDSVNGFARSIGCEYTSLNRTMTSMVSEAENYTSAEDLAKVFLLLYRCELISPDYSASMLNMLKAHIVNDRIPAGLPKGTECAHHTGDQKGKCVGDAGLVFTPGADYILAVISNDAEDDAQAKADIVELSRLVYEQLNPETGETPEPGPSEP